MAETLHRVEVREVRTTILYVMAESADAATAAADELTTTHEEWEDVDTELDAREADAPFDDTAPVWVGGESGRWVPWDEIASR